MDNKSKFLIIGIVLILIVTLLSTSFGLLRVSDEIGTQKVIAGTFNINFEDGDTVKLENTAPMSDEEGMKTKSYDMKITNIGDVDALYTLKLEEDDDVLEKDKLKPNQIKYSIKVGDEEWSEPRLLSTIQEQVLVKEQELNAKSNNKTNCNIRLWVDENVGNEGQNKIYKAKIVLEAVQKEIDIEENN